MSLLGANNNVTKESTLLVTDSHKAITLTVFLTIFDGQ